MKKDYEQAESDHPVLNTIFIGLYIAALVILLTVLFRRFFPVFNNLLDNIITL
ncbi:MAG: hypothetical protein LIO85_08140 [Rikenellaceae bacterium]|nr:hypothetical protein [Rikenellaceae bacterium]